MNFINKLSEEMLHNSTHNIIEDVRIDEASMKGFIDSIKKMFRTTSIFFKKVRGQVITLFKRGRETSVINLANNKVVMKWSGKTVYINPNLLSESTTISSLDVFDKILYEALTPAEIAKRSSREISKIGAGIGDVEEPESALYDIQNAKVTFDELYTIFDQLAFGVKFRTSYEQKIPSLLLMGPPGAGKTTVTDFFGEKKGMVVKKLEIGSIYKEIIGGFPIIKKVLSPSSPNIDWDSLNSEEKKQLKEEATESVVRIVQSDLLPPNKDTRPWLLFMDEFNRDSEKMGAVMNLCLTGNIGASYYLPMKTLVVASGNVGGEGDDGDDVPVAEMDSATWDRFSRKVILTYDWIARAEYGKKETVYGGKTETETPYEKQVKAEKSVLPEVKKKRKYFETPENEISMGGDVPVIANFMHRTTKEKGTAEWKINLTQFDPDAKAVLSPRTLSILDGQMKDAAFKDWLDDDLVGSKDKKWYEDNYKKANAASAPAYYLHVNQLNKRYFGDIARTVLGAAPGDVITSMFTEFQKTKEEAENVSVEDVLAKWTNIRKDRPKPPPKLANEFALMLPDLLAKFKTKATFKKFISGNNVTLPDAIKGDVAVWAATNIHNFLVDSKMTIEVAAGIAKNLAELREPTPAEGSEDDKGKKSVKNQFLDEVLSFLIKNSKIFGKAWSVVADAAEEDAEGTSALKRATTFANKGMLMTGTPPDYITTNLSGRKLRDYLFVTNIQMIAPKFLKTVKIKKEEEGIEEAMKRLFKKMV